MSDDSQFLELMRSWVRITVRHAMRATYHAARESGLSMPQAVALMQIRRGRDICVSGMGESLGVSSAAASQMLDKLVLMGFARREQNSEDRRRKDVVLTEQGVAASEHIALARRRWVEELAAGLKPSERASAIPHLARIIETSERLGMQHAQAEHCGSEEAV